jgi:hypothetical protein
VAGDAAKLGSEMAQIAIELQSYLSVFDRICYSDSVGASTWSNLAAINGNGVDESLGVYVPSIARDGTVQPVARADCNRFLADRRKHMVELLNCIGAPSGKEELLSCIPEEVREVSVAAGGLLSAVVQLIYGQNYKKIPVQMLRMTSTSAIFCEWLACAKSSFAHSGQLARILLSGGGESGGHAYAVDFTLLAEMEGMGLLRECLEGDSSFPLQWLQRNQGKVIPFIDSNWIGGGPDGGAPIGIRWTAGRIPRSGNFEFVRLAGKEWKVVAAEFLCRNLSAMQRVA